jgi:hypothetical protein
MANWAVVIGVDQYWTPEACLRGAVRDALKMQEWLLSADGGNVPAENLSLLLSPAEGEAELDISEATGASGSTPATRDNIVLALDELLERSKGRGERFFFYFAGHGATARIDFSNQDSIVPADFTPRLTSKAIPLRSIFEYFQASQFAEQFFFVDACRNIPWEKEEREFRVGPLDVPRRPQPPVPPQFIMYATAPLLRALELRRPGDEQGVFTSALLDGLRGEGPAKVWDDCTQAYVLRWDRLFQYVDGHVCALLARQRSVDEAGPDAATGVEVGGRDVQPRQRAEGPWPQRPRQAGERGGENPVLAGFGQRAFPVQPLEVDLEPEEALPEAEIVVGDLGGEVARRSEIEALPVRFQLPPKTYSVRAWAAAYRSERPYYPIDLYEPQTLEVRLVPEPEVQFKGVAGPLEGLGPVVRRGLYTSPEMAPEALVAARAISDVQARAEALAGLLHRLPTLAQMAVFGEALDAIQAIADEGSRALALVDLGKALPARFREEARAVAGDLADEGYRTLALAGLEPQPGSLRLSSADSLAQIELADGAGRRLVSGEGSLELPNQAPGFYRARLVTPEGRSTEKLVELPSGGRVSVQLEAPVPPNSRLFREVAARGGLEVAEDNTVRLRHVGPPTMALGFAEDVGAVAAAQLSTLLALAGGAANEPGAGGALPLCQVGISAFHDLVGAEAGSGVQILFGIDEGGEQAAAHLTLDEVKAETQRGTALLAETRLRCWAQGEAPPAETSAPLLVPDLPGLAQFAWPLAPGAHWLAIETPGQRPVAFATAVLPSRLTLIVFTRSAEGEVALYQYLPLLMLEGGYDARTARDERTGARYPMLQRSELVQRAYARGRLDGTGQNARDLLYAKWFEPVAGCLGAHMTLQLEPDSNLLRVAVGNLARYFGGLVDSHVLYAARQEALGGGDPAAAYRAALDVGLPLLDESLVRLQEGIARHAIEHERVSLVQRVYERRVCGLLWTAIALEELAV